MTQAPPPQVDVTPDGAPCCCCGARIISPKDPRIARLAAFLYGLRWTVGQRTFLELPASSRRQWLEQARAGIAAIDGVPP